MKKEKKNTQQQKSAPPKEVPAVKKPFDQPEEVPERTGILPDRDLKKNLGCG